MQSVSIRVEKFVAYKACVTDNLQDVGFCAAIIIYFRYMVRDKKRANKPFLIFLV